MHGAVHRNRMKTFRNFAIILKRVPLSPLSSCTPSSIYVIVLRGGLSDY